LARTFMLERLARTFMLERMACKYTHEILRMQMRKLGEEVETANWLGKCIDMKPNGAFYAIAPCAQTTPLDEVTVGRSDSWTK
jgi:hypothetical protein